MRWLLDTNVISEATKPRPDPRVIEWLEARASSDFAISVLTLGEILRRLSLMPAGARRERLEQWLAHELPRQFYGRVLAVDEKVALAWGRLTAECRIAGNDPPAVDGLLLATAAAYDLVLVTRNEADCAGRGVPVLNPWGEVQTS